ncbi:Kinase [Hexamita inflata]|uniref:cyclin-dependent kinase n=1 Tax=Hexamita inflata TaxID=28002 RepID=A0AA86QNI6_9EUKA|nr:CMGC CDKL [Hexamita inflata]CAI9956314.1 CMGC CDKL [Hexamita inflata]
MNKYEILGNSGEGAYGVVLKCRNKETNSLVAIKKFKDLDDPEDLNFRKTTLREIKLLKNAIHPNIVRLLEAFKRKQRLYLVFEYCDSTILEMLEKSNGIQMDEVRTLTFQIIRSVDFLHSNHIIHRDLKPENLLVLNTTIQKQPAKVVKLCDFGFARHVNAPGAAKDYQPQDLTDYVATRWYRAPELLLNATDYNASVDVWAIALIIVEMITSQPLFPGDSDVDQLYLIQKVLGNMTRKQMEKFLRNPKFIGIKMPDLHGRVEGLEKRLQSKIKDKNLLFMLENMLKMEPSERWTCQQCLASEWFDPCRKQCLNTEIELWRELGVSSDQVQVDEVKVKRDDDAAGSRQINRITSQSPRLSQAQVENHNIISIGVPDDLPNLPQSKGGSRAKARDAGVNVQMMNNYGFKQMGLPGLPGLPKYGK